MQFIDGIYIFYPVTPSTTKLQPANFRLHPINNPIPVNSYILKDFNQTICIFNSANNTKVYLIYDLEYEADLSILTKINELSDENYVIIKNEYYYLDKCKTVTPISKIFFKDNQIHFNNEINKENEEQKEFVIKEEISNRKLGQAIPSYLSPFEPNQHTQIKNFVFSSSKEEQLFGYILLDAQSPFLIVSSFYFSNFESFLINIFNIKDQHSDLLYTLLDIPLFPHRYLNIRYNNDILYQTNSNLLVMDIPPHFLISLLSLILQENKILFIANNPQLIFHLIMYCDSIIKPFGWQYALCTPLPESMFDLLDSPFPFIIGIIGEIKQTMDDKGTIKTVYNFPGYENRDMFSIIKENKISAIDLNNLSSINKAISIPFSRELADSIQLAVSEDEKRKAFKKYFTVLKNNIVIAREKTIDKILDDSNPINNLKYIIDYPGEIRENIRDDLKEFFNDFFQTRIFKRFISMNDDEYRCSYSININNKTSQCVFIPYVLLDNISESSVIKLWLKLYDGDLMKPALTLIERTKKSEIIVEILRRLSKKGLIDDIIYLINLLNIKMKPEMYQAINIKEENMQMPTNFMQYYNLASYKIIPINICKCKILKSKKIIPWDFKSQQKINVNMKEKDCVCNNYCSTSILVLNGDAIVGLYRLITPENAAIWINALNNNELSKQSLIINQPILFWCIIFYFLYFDLPINIIENKNDIKVDVIIEENYFKKSFNCIKGLQGEDIIISKESKEFDTMINIMDIPELDMSYYQSSKLMNNKK
ncbi:DENN domain-containing protein 2C [Astathelohania contejeani]|uniref:DENN domain-containing protein 2C n=1 Tax=Astathelohania contejeani TaxID=164912 RepID=A0ABQ7HWJ7_9MICR|nr:DENN domain-containing protein 2C [Thelohania contejeani]